MHNDTLQKGQALITFLFFTIIAMAVVSAAVVTVLLNSLGNAAVQDGQAARALAETGMDNALLRLIREPAYSSETYSVSGNTVQTTVTGSGPYTVVTKGTVGSYTHTVTATATYSAGMFTVLSWQEQ